MPETIPDQTSNAGPEYRSATDEMDWRDFICEAADHCKEARHIEREPFLSPVRANRNRIKAIEDAIEALNNAKELLCR